MKLTSINTDYGCIPIIPAVEQSLIDEDELIKRIDELWNLGFETAWIDGTVDIHPESADDIRRVYLLLNFSGSQYIEITNRWEKLNAQGNG